MHRKLLVTGVILQRLSNCNELVECYDESEAKLNETKNVRYGGAPWRHNNSPVAGYPQKPPAYERPRFISEEPGRFPFRAGIKLPPSLLIQAVETPTEPDFLIPEPELEPLGNESLPIFAYKAEIQQSVRDNQVTIVVGETGSGKSTQVPQFVHEMGIFKRTFLTQPRRAATLNVFSRIREEITAARGTAVGYSSVRYQTAATHDGPPAAPIIVETDGLRLVSEYGNEGLQDGDCGILDEVHEFNKNTEFLLAGGKQLLAKNPNVRFIITSATVDAPKIKAYFDEVCSKPCNIIEVEGRTFPVERHEKPDSTVADETLKAATDIIKNGSKAITEAERNANAILVFMPGKREIADMIDELHRRMPAWMLEKSTILPLHAKQTVEEQQKAFDHYEGVKIIVATNVAQTSLTIPDVRYVIDSGLERRVELDHEGVQGLVLNQISQADCDQRAGRAGRVTDGIYILTPITRGALSKAYIGREKYPVPEIMRTDTIRNTLRLSAIGVDINEVDLLHPINYEVIKQAQKALRMLGALDETGKITEIGVVMNRFPVNASSGRMIAESQRFASHTREYVSVIAAAIEVGGLQDFSPHSGKAWRELTEDSTSDLLAQLDLFINTIGMSRLQQHEYDIDVSNLERAHELYRKILQRQGLNPREISLPTDSDKEDILQCIYAGMIDSIYTHVGEKLFQNIGDPTSNVRQLSNRSVVYGKPELVVGVPYRVEVTKPDGTEVERHIIGNVTIASAAAIGRVASHLTRWVEDEPVIRGGKIYLTHRQKLGHIDLGVTKEVAAPPSPELHARIVQYAIDNPGKSQRQLRGIKAELEKLAHLAKDPVPQLTQEAYIRHIAQAIPEDATDLTRLDTYIREYIEQGNISIDMFVSDERRAMIERNAPATVEVGNITLRVQYKNGKPVVESYRAQDIFALVEDPFLTDGRQILFVKRLPDVAAYKVRDAFDQSDSSITVDGKVAQRAPRSNRHKLCNLHELRTYLEELQNRDIQI